ncbi:hypothetical protein CO009_00855 [Candidatus Shapirobacteria bacterium CG_4_8_14_3_um_filter_35_11]|uniref:Uncharacterized protein n=5 Tax=Candidatus Shapironibacteriota TaxID=1752721 RepID=A0A1J5I5P1_9BACT|nr:MAG: hypothetical protein AUK05_03465 [Candidatus Shapirobacteria bacterium CG2_30_35_20]PIV07787.1 MAG: hypothetical protein COS53_00560 [Candidatus Shapirobacteria bacterium CG03_land_8_20_14_0_80_35_14]PIX68167.1 MAG: hypothetical protein COZ41_01100 [Candidatus Shapirobacteria bacterium CG_4_10_14_3_um_filter_35_13]PJA51090.1 MAG: hypothetical protein CO168_01725 [Candidatus Shapirobacteria bacterium CG_4_9_14_3_um_filter_36_12]PJC80932.1 MAG: hypothetical protein CO009_00855 [Candidatus
MKKILLLLLTILGTFVLWMNVTPGHFQESCCGNVEYSRRVTSVGCITFCDSKPISQILINNFLVFASIFDFYK